MELSVAVRALFAFLCTTTIAFTSSEGTVIQRRDSGAVNFNRSWSQYQYGFGFLSTEFWIGNEKLSYLTNQADYEVRVDMELSNGASFYTTYKGFHITDEWGQYKVTHIGPLESNAPTLPSTCPTNMIYGTCTCQATCEDPDGKSGCKSDCLGSEGCTCPPGFFMQGSDCISAIECGCFVAEVILILPSGQTYVNDDCTQHCSCNNNQLICEDYVCNTNAVCDVRNGVRQCYCNEGFEGDGENCPPSVSYRDCQDVYDAGHRQDGVYTIMPTGWPGLPFDVHCKMENGGGWTVFQRRTDDSTNFYQNWNMYKDGFGHSGNLWLGNEKLHYLTNQRNYKLRYDITTSSGSATYAEYTEFQIESEINNYRMNKLGTHSGDTGHYLSSSRGKQFSTHDRDNDACGNFNCAQLHRSGWWHYDHSCSYCWGSNYCSNAQYSSRCKSKCTYYNLNGVYNGGNGEMIYSSLSICNPHFVEMKIRPSS
ncbi:uncharacterized protein [Apostichopus japonicus]|uniref:uncharacterized protein isoform X2 n=1 Tax=Stichopus japonicus TaxID=307972 RepID=UPI003AB78FC3